MADSESHVWKTLKKIGARRMWMERFECQAPNVPDVHYLTQNEVAGWIELKNIKELPKRMTTPVRIKHFTNGQKLWLRTYGSLGGNAWVFIGFPDDVYMLFSWKVVYCLGSWTYAELCEHAELILTYPYPFSRERLINVLERKPQVDACHIEPSVFLL
jgi:hypothetical protein